MVKIIHQVGWVVGSKVERWGVSGCDFATLPRNGLFLRGVGGFFSQVWGKAFMAFPFELGCGCGGVECFSDSFADFFFAS